MCVFKSCVALFLDIILANGQHVMKRFVSNYRKCVYPVWILLIIDPLFFPFYQTFCTMSICFHFPFLAVYLTQISAVKRQIDTGNHICCKVYVMWNIFLRSGFSVRSVRPRSSHACTHALSFPVYVMFFLIGFQPPILQNEAELPVNIHTHSTRWTFPPLALLRVILVKNICK